MRIFVVATAMFFASVGHAAPCTEAYTIDSLLADMVAVEGSLRSGNDADAGTLAKQLEAGLACTDEILPGMILGRAMRGIGAGLFKVGMLGPSPVTPCAFFSRLFRPIFPLPRFP